MSAAERLRRLVAGIDPRGMSLVAQEASLATGVEPIDAALGGGLAWGALHELAPSQAVHLGAVSGFALALAGLAIRKEGCIVWIQTRFAMVEMGRLYGLGVDLLGLSPRRLLMVRVARSTDALWAMEEALAHGARVAVAELPDEGRGADLTATRRLSLAAREGGGLGCLIRHQAANMPSAAVTRWSVAAASSVGDSFGGLGRAAFDLSLVKNRRGSCGRWIVSWDHHEHTFIVPEAVPLGLASEARNGSDRAGVLYRFGDEERAACHRSIHQEHPEALEPERHRRAAGA